MQSVLADYLTELALKRANPLSTGELSLRDALSGLLNQSAKELGKDVQFVGEAKVIAQGTRPDYIITHGDLPIGYIEAEKYDSDLDNLKGHAKKQNDAFIADLDNFLLTNHLDNRLYSKGDCVASVTFPSDPKLLTDAHATAWLALCERMLQGEIQTIAAPKDLAVLLSRRARLLAGAALADLAIDDESPVDFAYAQFKAELLTDIDRAEFADVYAETLTYGLFAARCLSDDKFTVASADRALREIPLLSSLFHDYEFRLDDNLRWILEEIVALLDAAPIANITDYFANRSGRADPMLDFYEPFLAAFDPRKREARGVYYTPEPVVGYMVRSVAALLERDFNRRITDKEVRILDPATGTGSFLFAVADEIHRQIVAFDAASWNAQTVENTLARLFGLELMVAPYTIAHLKLRLQFGAWGTLPKSRVGIYLSNTLDDPRGTYGGATVEMAQELKTGDAIKTQTEILVVIGNPPYAGHSANITKREVAENVTGSIQRKGKTVTYTESRKALKHNQIGTRVESYKTVDGAPLGERNSKWLQDDYVKFLAFAQNRIARTGEGIVAFITNHGYLDNPTFRGLRASLMDEFDALYVLDLHGNAKKKEVAPGGGKDENVFAIQQGVAILLAVKTRASDAATASRASVYHADLWGRQAKKYAALDAQDILTTPWQSLTPTAPHYLFVPRDETHLAEYEQGWKVTDIFPINGWGVATRKDYLLVDFDRDNVISKFKDIKKLSVEDAITKYKIKTSPHWDFAKAQKLMADDTNSQVKKVLFRPFDFRYFYYEKCMIERGDHRYDLMKNLFQPNLALITVRRVETSTFGHFFCTSEVTVLHSVSAKEGNFVFPLYLYVKPKAPTKEETGTLAELDLKSVGLEKRANLNQKFVAAITSIIGVAASPEAIFDYIYATLHRPDYRGKYAAFLKTDFPRIPLPRDGEQFEALRSLGARLVALHLLDTKKAPALAQSSFKPIGAGDNVVTGARYDGGEQTIYFNATRGFAPVPRAVWEFKIGGYQVAKKWLDDRKGRALEFEELQHYTQVLAALQGTIEAMETLESLAQ